MSRFINIYEKDYINVFFDGFPVIMQKSRILFDSEADRIVIQFKLMNTDTSAIEKVFLKVDLLDLEKNTIKTVDKHIILSDAKQGESFGENSPIYENDKNISSCDVIITKVMFSGGRSWVNEDNSMGLAVSPASPIYFPDKLMQQFQADAAKAGIKPSCKFEEHEKCWRCSCGMLNGNDKKICSDCGTDIASIRECFSENKLTGKLEERHKKRKKNLITRIFICFVIIMAIMVMFNVLNYYMAFIANPSYGNIGIAEYNNNAFFVNKLGFIIGERPYRVLRTVGKDKDGNSCYYIYRNNKYGVINDKGKWIIKPTYENSTELENSIEFKEKLRKAGD